MTTKTYSYIGKGRISLQRRVSAAAAFEIGNCSSLNFSVETSALSQPDYRNLGGGLANEIQRVDSVNAALTLLELSPENIGLALRGVPTLTAGGAVTGEQHNVAPGSVVHFAKLPDMDVATVVTLNATPDPIAMVVGTDYDRTPTGIRILAGSAIVTVPGVVTVGYTGVGMDTVEALTNTGEEFRLVFGGLNEAESGRRVKVTAHRVKFSPTSGLEFLGDDFGNLPVEASLLSDDGITGAALSRFFKVDFE